MASGGLPAAECLGAEASPTVGKACGCDRDCDSTDVCIPEVPNADRPGGMPGGLCIRPCDSAAACPDTFACVELTPGDPDTQSCLELCTTTSQCRIGYLCRVWPPDPDVTDTYCMAFCQSDDDCPRAEHCNLYTGACGEVEPAGKAANGEPCTQNSECISDFCIGPYCASYCSLERQGCPDGGGCALSVYEVGDLGGCMPACESTADCPSGTSCGPSEVPDLSVCY